MYINPPHWGFWKTLVVNLTGYFLDLFRWEKSSQKFENMFPEFTQLVKSNPDSHFLEIGSRVVTGATYKQHFGDKINYTGFDILEGSNVDVVGDAHKLSTYFPDKKFDFIFSASVFEHLIMPWKVVLEMNKVLKVGGKVYIFTHPAYALHEEPWDFFRFSKYSFHGLFNKKTGFEIVDMEDGIPARMISTSRDEANRFHHIYRMKLGVNMIAQKVSEPAPGLDWDVGVDEITDTMYPKSD